MATEPDSDSIVGYVVAGFDGEPILKIDWDGEVHATRRDGDLALLECHRAGYRDYRVYALVDAPEACDDDG